MPHLPSSIIFLIINLRLLAQTSGTIYYEDGSTQRFSDIDYIEGILETEEMQRERNYEPYGQVGITSDNTTRNMILSNLDYFNVRYYYLGDYYLTNVTVEVKTKAGKLSNIEMRELRYLVGVGIYDELSGAQTRIEYIYFLQDGRLAVRKIVFD